MCTLFCYLLVKFTSYELIYVRDFLHGLVHFRLSPITKCLSTINSFHSLIIICAVSLLQTNGNSLPLRLMVIVDSVSVYDYLDSLRFSDTLLHANFMILCLLPGKSGACLTYYRLCFKCMNHVFFKYTIVSIL